MRKLILIDSGLEPIQRFTIIGSKGFIGSHLDAYLQSVGHVSYMPHKGDADIFKKPLGSVFYCAGLTSDFRIRPFDTIEAHVSFLSKLLQLGNFDSLLYLSSTRVYIYSPCTNEDAPLAVKPKDSEDIFNISKLMGESVCLNSGRENVKVARLSNVLGADFDSDNFLFSILREAAKKGSIELRTTLDSEKDYIHIKDVVELLLKILLEGKSSIYNVASGINLKNSEILKSICEAIPAKIRVGDHARQIRFLPIETKLIIEEFKYEPRPILPFISDLCMMSKNLAGRTAINI